MAAATMGATHLSVAVCKPPTGERRVALDPATAGRLAQRGWIVRVESGAGDASGFTDDAYDDASAVIIPSISDGERSDIVLVTGALGGPGLALADRADGQQSFPADEDDDEWLSAVAHGSVVIGAIGPTDRPELVSACAERGQSLYSLDILPRTSRALMADVASSQGTIAGYRAAVLASAHLSRAVPLLVTPAGTLPPARVLVVGSGPVGLQAAATARRMGAIVELYDPRAIARETVESLGVVFIGGDLVTSNMSERPSRAEAARQQQALLADHARHADAVILTAIAPGRPAPRLLSVEAVEDMAEGSVIVDLAAAWGGNCELTVLGETTEIDGVLILGPRHPASDFPAHASLLFSHNVEYFLGLLARDGGLPLAVDEADPVVRAGCVVDHGNVIHNPTRARLGLDPIAGHPEPVVDLPGGTDDSGNDRERDAQAPPVSDAPVEGSRREGGGLRGTIGRFGKRGGVVAPGVESQSAATPDQPQSDIPLESDVDLSEPNTTSEATSSSEPIDESAEDASIDINLPKHETESAAVAGDIDASAVPAEPLPTIIDNDAESEAEAENAHIHRDDVDTEVLLDDLAEQDASHDVEAAFNDQPEALDSDDFGEAAADEDRGFGEPTEQWVPADISTAQSLTGMAYPSLSDEAEAEPSAIVGTSLPEQPPFLDEQSSDVRVDDVWGSETPAPEPSDESIDNPEADRERMTVVDPDADNDANLDEPGGIAQSEPDVPEAPDVDPDVSLEVEDAHPDDTQDDIPEGQPIQLPPNWGTSWRSSSTSLDEGSQSSHDTPDQDQETTMGSQYPSVPVELSDAEPEVPSQVENEPLDDSEHQPPSKPTGRTFRRPW